MQIPCIITCVASSVDIVHYYSDTIIMITCLLILYMTDNMLLIHNIHLVTGIRISRRLLHSCCFLNIICCLFCFTTGCETILIKWS